MPVTPTYPGVYIQEVGSGSSVIMGVATSITAFVGRTVQGPANTPMMVNNFGEFSRYFGGLSRDLPMPYTVRDFFTNGGSQAVIVRVCAGPPLGAPATAELGTKDAPYTLTSGVQGTFSNLMTIGATRTDAGAPPAAGATPAPDAGQPPAGGTPPPANDADATYDVTVMLGTVEIAALPDVSPATLDMTLKSLTGILSVSGSLADDAAAKVALDAMATPVKFTGGADQGTPKPANFQAAPLKITASVPGSWTDDLDLSLLANGTKGFLLQADHPFFPSPLVVPFTTWDELTAGLAKTELLATATGATAPTADPKDFIGSGIPLTRIPDGSGAAAAMLVRGPLVLMASSPGAWGNQLGVYFDQKGIKSPKDLALRYADFGNLDPKDFWNVNVFQVQKGQSPPYTQPAETIGAVYLGPIDAPCRIDHMLKQQSNLLSARPPLASPKISDLILDPSKVGVLQDPANAKLGMLWGGQDGETMSTQRIIGDENAKTGMYALKTVDLFNILVIPPDPMLGGDDDMNAIYTTAASFCSLRRAMLIADPLDRWGFAAKKGQFDRIQPTDIPLGAITSRRSTFAYFPRVLMPDPLNNNRERVFSAAGIIAGIFATTDVTRGVWKAPAGIDAGLAGVTGLEYKLTDDQNGILNQVGVNVLRNFPVIGPVVWGSRTMAGADLLSDDYKYVPVRRLTDFIEESLYRGTQYAVFEPNTDTLWQQLRASIGSFMADLMRQGAFYNYFVTCDASTTTQYDIDRGRVNVTIAFAPVKPAEFVILTIQQLAGQTAA